MPRPASSTARFLFDHRCHTDHHSPPITNPIAMTYSDSVLDYADDLGLLDLDVAAQVLEEHGRTAEDTDLPEAWDNAHVLLDFLGY